MILVQLQKLLEPWTCAGAEGGLETPRDYSQPILRTLETVPRNLTKRYEPVFTRLAVVKVSPRLASYQHVAPPS